MHGNSNWILGIIVKHQLFNQALPTNREGLMVGGGLVECVARNRPPAYSRAVDVKGAMMIEGTFVPPQSRVEQHRRDLRLIIEAAARSGHKLPFAATHAGVLDAAIADGAGDLDNAAIIDTIRHWRG